MINLNYIFMYAFFNRLTISLNVGANEIGELILNIIRRLQHLADRLSAYDIVKLKSILSI